MPFVLYGCETLSLTLREECRLWAFENRIPRRIFGPKSDENGDWKRVIKSRRLKWAGHLVSIELVRSALIIVKCKPSRRRLLGRPRLR